MGQNNEEIRAQARLCLGCVSSSASASRYRSTYQITKNITLINTN
jgi:hypothetical protein